MNQDIEMLKETRANLLQYLLTLKPKTEADIMKDIKTYINTDEATDLHEFKKNINIIIQPYNYVEICEYILNNFGIVYKPADVKKLLSIIGIIPH